MRDGLGPSEPWADAFATRYLNPPELHAELPDLSTEDAEPLL